MHTQKLIPLNFTGIELTKHFKRLDRCKSDPDQSAHFLVGLFPALSVVTFPRLLLIALVILLGTQWCGGSDLLSPDMPGYSDILNDWKDQDKIGSKGYRQAIIDIIQDLPSLEHGSLKKRVDVLAGVADDSKEMVDLYIQACSKRRANRMAGYVDRFRRVVFSEHDVRGGSWFYQGYPSAGGYEGKGLMLLEMDGLVGKVTPLLKDGEARDPDISYDGNRVVFAWRNGSSGSSEYQIHEMDLRTRTTRRITSEDNKYSIDMHPTYLPNGDIVFVSTRYVQAIDCARGQVANLFLCDKDGKYMRQVGFDQVPVLCPCVMPSGEVVYARWDYNDKSHTYGHALFIMNPHGTAQREFCNNNSWWPTMILQQRSIPGTMKIMAMIGGYHTKQWGKIGIINTAEGLQNGEGVTLVAPLRRPEDDDLDSWGGFPGGPYPFRPVDAAAFPKKGAAPLDSWGQDPPMFAYPYPFDEDAFLVSFQPKDKSGKSGWDKRMALYFMTVDGERELLYHDPNGSCMAAVPAVARPVPPVLANTVDYRDSTGIFQMANVYTSQSPLLDGVAPGTIKRLRVVALYFRPGPISMKRAYHCGPGCINNGGASYNLPIATTNASWDAKWIVGETPVHSDGSAAFIVPARLPLFFQALDAKGHVVQTMRSWATLQPGETFNCIGCHESRLQSPPPLNATPIAIKLGAKPLEPFYGPMRPFSFRKEIQPILDNRCVRCHNGNASGGGLNLEKDTAYETLTKHGECDNFSKYVSWFHAEDSPILQPPYRAGSSQSLLVKMLEDRRMPKEGSLTKEELDKIICWIDIGVPECGTYEECHPGSEANLEARQVWLDQEKNNLEAYVRGHPVPVTNRGNHFIHRRAASRRLVLTGLRGAILQISPLLVRGRILARFYDLRGKQVRAVSFHTEKTGDGRVGIGAPLVAGHYILKITGERTEQLISVILCGK